MTQRFEFSLPAEVGKIGPTVKKVLAVTPSWVDAVALDTGLTEALSNAIIHGVLEVTSSSRGDDFLTYLDQVEQRSKEKSEVAASVELAVTCSETKLEIELSWLGAACPPEKQAPRSSPDPLAGSGLGGALIQSCCDEVTWRADGRGLSLRFLR